MGNAHHPLHNIFSQKGFDPDLSPIRFNEYGISILKPKFFCRFLMNLCIGFWTLLLETFDVSMLGMRIIKDSSTCCENERILLKQLEVSQRALIGFPVGRERIKTHLLKSFRIDLDLLGGG